MSRSTLRAVVPAHIGRRWDAIAVQQLAAIVAAQALEIEQLRAEIATADDCAEHWREEAFRLHEELARVTGTEKAITRACHLVTTASEPPQD